MSDLDAYLQAADRVSTVRSYASAIRHYEQERKGLLPATSDAVARYLVAYAPVHAISTLWQRLAALARWHAEQGFADPTRSPLVRKVLRGVRAKHTADQKHARPLELDQVQQVSDWLQRQQEGARQRRDRASLLRLTGDRSILLLGFWRAFRSDELVRMRVEDVETVPGTGLTCRLSRSKGDRELEGRVFHCPALSRLCPVEAYLDWLAISGRTTGPVYPRIDRWGNLSEEAMHSTSLIPLLRELFRSAGVASSSEYSSHSLRRGFAGCARASGRDLKQLMEYVGRKDVKSALRYLDAPTASLQQRFEKGLMAAPAAQPPAAVLPVPVAVPAVPVGVAAGPELGRAVLHLKMKLSRMSGATKGLARAQRLIEKTCFVRFAVERLDESGKRFALTVPFTDRDGLEEVVFALLDDMYRIAGDCECLLEATLHEPATGARWD